MARQTEERDVYRIPENFVDTGTVMGGMFKLRNPKAARLRMTLNHHGKPGIIIPMPPATSIITRPI